VTGPDPEKEIKMKITQTQISQAALNFFNAAEKTVINLASRWADECKHENIDDYKTHLVAIAAEHGVSVEKMCKRPFGCEFAADGKRFLLTLKMSTGSYSYKRIA
jgi:hypothetical protein